MSKLYLNGEVDEVIPVYTDFQSVLSQNATAIQLLPLRAEARNVGGGHPHRIGAGSFGWRHSEGKWLLPPSFAGG